MREFVDVDDFDEDVFVDGLDRYDEALAEQQWCTITEIVVPTDHDKEQLLKAFKYIHDLRSIDSDYMAVNTIMHLYQVPELIKVRPL